MTDPYRLTNLKRELASAITRRDNHGRQAANHADAASTAQKTVDRLSAEIQKAEAAEAAKVRLKPGDVIRVHGEGPTDTWVVVAVGKREGKHLDGVDDVHLVSLGPIFKGSTGLVYQREAPRYAKVDI